jgi:hypothetical protein
MEMEEPTWRKAEGEERDAFLGYYLSAHVVKKSINVFRVIFGLIFFISLGELVFERLCKNDPSYNPTPMYICILASIFILIINEVICRLVIRRTQKSIENNIYVTDAIAYPAGTNKVAVMINHKKIAFDTYDFKETVSPTDDVYDENSNKIGFRVRLYLVLYNGAVETKKILGDHGYNYYMSKFQKNDKQDKHPVSAKA